jgi:hypothetical protein
MSVVMPHSLKAYFASRFKPAGALIRTGHPDEDEARTIDQVLFESLAPMR